jgi:hypothetical protein
LLRLLFQKVDLVEQTLERTAFRNRGGTIANFPLDIRNPRFKGACFVRMILDAS